MIDLSSEPSLGSLVLTRDGVMKYSYILPLGQEFPVGTTARLTITDRGGGEYDGSPFAGTMNAAKTSFSWFVEDLPILNLIPAGANFEVFVTMNTDEDYKVRYGRVVRKEVAFPLNPLAAESPPLMYEDDLQRSIVGPRWVAKYGKVGMHDPPSTAAIAYGMAARNNLSVFGAGVSLWSSAAVLWYAPLQSDSVEVQVGLCDGGDGTTVIPICCDYRMKNFMGVRFYDPTGAGDLIQIVTGSAWNTLVNRGSTYAHIVPDAGSFYTIRYSITTNTISVWVGTGTGSAVLSWTDSTNVVQHGPGQRYVGAIFNGTLVNTGPQMYYFKAKDTV